MANLVIAFAEILVGGVLMDAAIKGDTISNVITGKATSHPFAGTNTSSSGGGSGSSAAPGSAGPAPGSGGSGSYVNPFGKATGVKYSRTDQGVDVSMTPGSPILAPADSKIVAVVRGFYQNQWSVVARILDGPLNGKYYYATEQITPSVAVNDIVVAGQKIGSYASTGTAIEFGFAAPTSSPGANYLGGGFTTLAQSTTGYVEGEATAAGQSMLAFLKSLGFKA